MHHVIKHPALTIVIVFIVASCLYGFAKMNVRTAQESIFSVWSTLSVTQTASADQSAKSDGMTPEYAMDYALATGGWIAPRTH